MRLELPVIRVQVQLDHMKPGLPPRRRYEPRILREVASLRVTADGVVGVDADGTEYVDVHNRNHPHSRNSKGRNGISIMTTGDYAALRARYGPHVTDGIAGESLLLDYPAGLAGRPMPDGLGVAGGDVMPGTQVAAALALTGVHVAKPCVEFTRFCLQRADFDVDDAIKEGLADLDNGARGYKMTAGNLADENLEAGSPTSAIVRPGDIVVCDLPD